MGLQFGIKEVLDVNILNYATKNPVAFIDYATANTNENAAERLFLTGGKGNARLMSFDHSKTSTFTLTLPMVDLKVLAMLAGDDLINDSTANIYKREELTAQDNAGTTEVTLSSEPVGTPKVFKLEGIRDYGEEVTGGTVSGSSIDLTSAGVTAGEKVIVLYQHAVATGSKQVKITSTKFPPAVEIHGTGLGKDQETELDHAIHVKVHKAKAQPNFTFTMSGTEATNLELTFDLFEVGGEYIDYIFEG